MDYIENMLIDFAWKLDEYYSGDESPDNIRSLVDEFLTEYDPYNQPERSKREDCTWTVDQVLRYVAKMPHRYKNKEEYDSCHNRCGALNTTVTA